MTDTPDPITPERDQSHKASNFGATPERVTLTEGIKALLDEHRWEPNWSRCSCGRGHIPTARSHRRHLAEVIARAAGEREAQIRARVETLAALYEVAGQMRTHQSWRAIAAEVRALLDGDEETTT